MSGYSSPGEKVYLSGYSSPGEKVECDMELEDGGTTLVGLWNPR